MDNGPSRDFGFFYPATSPTSPLPPSPFMLPPSPEPCLALVADNHHSSPSLSSSSSTSSSSSSSSTTSSSSPPSNFKLPLPPNHFSSSLAAKRRHVTATSSSPPSSSPPPSSLSLSLSHSSLPLLSLSTVQTNHSLSSSPTISFHPNYTPPPPPLSTSSSFLSTPHPPFSSPPSSSSFLPHNEISLLPQPLTPRPNEDESLNPSKDQPCSQKAPQPNSSCNIATITPTVTRLPVTRLPATKPCPTEEPSRDSNPTSAAEFQAINSTTTASSSSSSSSSSTAVTDSISSTNQASSCDFLTSPPRFRKSKLLRKKFRREKKSAFAAIFPHGNVKLKTPDLISMYDLQAFNPSMSRSLATVLSRYQEFLPSETQGESTGIDPPPLLPPPPPLHFHSRPMADQFLSIEGISELPSSNSASQTSSIPTVDFLSNLLAQPSLLSGDILVALKQRQMILQIQEQLNKVERSLQGHVTPPVSGSTPTKGSTDGVSSSLNSFLASFLSTAMDVGKCDSRFLTLLNETLRKTLKPVISSTPLSSIQDDNSFRVSTSPCPHLQKSDLPVETSSTVSTSITSSTLCFPTQLSPATSSSIISSSSATVPVVQPSVTSVQKNVYFNTIGTQKTNFADFAFSNKIKNDQQVSTLKQQVQNQSRFADSLIESISVNDSILTFTDSSPNLAPENFHRDNKNDAINIAPPLAHSENQKPIFRIVTGSKNNKTNKNLKRHRNRNQTKNKKSVEPCVPAPTTDFLGTTHVTPHVAATQDFHVAKHSSSSTKANQDLRDSFIPANVGVNVISSQGFNVSRGNLFNNCLLNVNKTHTSAIQNVARATAMENNCFRNPVKTSPNQYKLNPSNEISNIDQVLLNAALLNHSTNHLDVQNQILKERCDFLLTAVGQNLPSYFNVPLQSTVEVTTSQHQNGVTQINGKKVKLPLAGSLFEITEPIRTKTQMSSGVNSYLENANSLIMDGLNEMLHKRDCTPNQQTARKNCQSCSEVNLVNQYPGEIVPQYDRKLFKRISTTKENVNIIQQISDASIADVPIEHQNLNSLDKHPTKNSEILSYINSILNIFGSNKQNEISSACDLAVHQPLLFLKIYQQLASELSSANPPNVSKLNPSALLTTNGSLTNICSNSSAKPKILRLPKTETKKETLVCGSKILRMSVSSSPVTLSTPLVTASLPQPLPKKTPAFAPNVLPVPQLPQILPAAFATPTQTVHQFRPQNPPPSPPSPAPNELNINRSNEVIPPNVVLTTSSLTGARLDEIVRTTITNSNGRPSIVIPNLYKKKKAPVQASKGGSEQQSKLNIESQQLLTFPEELHSSGFHSTFCTPANTILQPNPGNLLDPSMFLNASMSESSDAMLENPASSSEMLTNTISASLPTSDVLSAKVESTDNAHALQSYQCTGSSGKNIFRDDLLALHSNGMTTSEYLVRLQNEKTAKLMELITLQEKLLETSKLTEMKCELLKKETIEANLRLMKSRQLALCSGLRQFDSVTQSSQKQRVTRMEQALRAQYNSIHVPSKSTPTLSSSSSSHNIVFPQNYFGTHGQGSYPMNVQNEANMSLELLGRGNSVPKRDSSNATTFLEKNSKDCFLFSGHQNNFKTGQNQFECGDGNTRAESQNINLFIAEEEQMVSDDLANPVSNSQEAPMDHQQLNRQLHQFFPDLYHFDSPDNDLSDLKRLENVSNEGDMPRCESQIEENVKSTQSEKNQAAGGCEGDTSSEAFNETENKGDKVVTQSRSQSSHAKQGITSEEEFREKLVELLDFVQNCSSSSPVLNSNNGDKSSASRLNVTQENTKSRSSADDPSYSEHGDSDVDELLDIISRSNQESNENTSMDVDDYVSFLSSAHFSVSSANESTTFMESPPTCDQFNFQLSSDMVGYQSNSENSSSGFGSVQSCVNRSEDVPPAVCMEVSYDQGVVMDGQTQEEKRLNENHLDVGFVATSPWFKPDSTPVNDFHGFDTNFQFGDPIKQPDSSKDTTSSSSSSSSSSSAATTSSYHHLELTPISPDEFPRRDQENILMEKSFDLHDKVLTFGTDIGCSSFGAFGSCDDDFIIREYFDQSLMF